MKVSSKARYAILALFDLAYHGDGQAMQSKVIAERQAIPPRFLEQIFQDLRRAGLVSSKRGPRGGYVLAHEPEAVRLGDILRAVEGSDRESETNLDGDELARKVADEVLREVASSYDAALDSFTLGDLRRRGAFLARTLGSKQRGDHFAI